MAKFSLLIFRLREFWALTNSRQIIEIWKNKKGRSFIFQIFFQKWLWRLFGTLSVDHNWWWLCHTANIWRSNNRRMPKLFRIWLNDCSMSWKFCNPNELNLFRLTVPEKDTNYGKSSDEIIVLFVDSNCYDK